MRHRLKLALFGALLALNCVPPAVPAHAFDFPIASPVTYGNLTAYPITGGGARGTAPLTLQQAMGQGRVRVYHPERGPAMIENLSDQPVFVQFGTLLAGGLQDQVVAQGLVVPPHSGLMPLPTFCADPFRSTGRDGEASGWFGLAGMLFPWRMAKLRLPGGQGQ